MLTAVSWPSANSVKESNPVGLETGALVAATVHSFSGLERAIGNL